MWQAASEFVLMTNRRQWKPLFLLIDSYFDSFHPIALIGSIATSGANTTMMITGNVPRMFFAAILCALLLFGSSLKGSNQAFSTNSDLSIETNSVKDDLPSAVAPATNKTDLLPLSPAPTTASLSDDPRMFDVFLFQNEIAILEIRIAELYDVVEKFVVVETAMSFQGNRQELKFDSLKATLPQRFLDKIVHHTCHSLHGGGTWDRERSARDCAQGGVLRAGARPYDLVHFCDADEILQPSLAREMLEKVKHMTQERDNRTDNELRKIFPIGLQLSFYYYNFLSDVGDPTFTDLFVILGDGKVNHLRRGSHRVTFIKGAGWHCSWCFPTVEHYANKFKSYSHTETMHAQNWSPENIYDCTCRGGNVFRHTPHMGGHTRHLVRMPLEKAGPLMPKYLFEHKDEPRFHFLVPNETTCKIPLS
jgi:hypothetical protein